MYPTLVIVMVETQRSMVDICEISSWNASKIAGPAASLATGHLSCAVGPIHSADNKSESLHSRVFELQRRDGQEHGSEMVILELKGREVDNSG